MGKGIDGWQPSGKALPAGRYGSPHAGATVLCAMLLALALAGIASAHAAGSAHPDEWDRLLLIVLGLGAIVAGIVFSIMFVALWRYRESSNYLRTEPSTHNFRLEAVWTTIPVILVTIVIILSLDVISTTEDLPEDAITIEVTGRQFEWEFRYPDNTSTLNDIWVEEGQVVIFEVRSEDVIHSFSLPDFRLKVDAFPNYVDEAYIIAEPAGTYDIYCAEFCGDIHSEMLGKLHIYEKGLNDKPWGPPPGEVPPPPETEHVTVDLELREDGGTSPDRPWSITPSLVDLPYEADVTLRIWNNGTVSHSFRLDPPYDRFLQEIPPGEFRYMNFTSDRPTSGVGGYCDDADHADRGMRTLVTVEQEPGGQGAEANEIDFPYVGGLFATALLVLGITAFMAVRTPSGGRRADHPHEPEEKGHERPRPGAKDRDGGGMTEEDGEQVEGAK